MKYLLLLTLLLTACQSAVVPATPTDAPVAISSPTSTPTATHTPVLEVAPIATARVCPPRLFARMGVGYVPGLDVGVKKSPVSVNIDCVIIFVQFDGAQMSGTLSEDGLTINNCLFSYDGKTYPCAVSIPVQSADNPYVQANGFVFKKSTKELICLAENNHSYAAACE